MFLKRIKNNVDILAVSEKNLDEDFSMYNF